MTKTISQQLAEKTFKELGIDPKTGKLLKEELRETKRTLGENRGTGHLTPPNSSYKSLKRNIGEFKSPPFRIKALEKTKRQSPRGLAYQHSALYRNAVILRLLVKKFTSGLNPQKYHRLIDQMDSSARSVVANIREGYLRPSSSEYSIFLGYSHGSLEEIRGDIIDAKDDRLLPSRPGTGLASLNISLKPSPNISPKVYLEELKRKISGACASGEGEIERSQLTYEIFIEIINKTYWLLKKAVRGLDEKIIDDEKNKLSQELNMHWRKHW